MTGIGHAGVYMNVAFELALGCLVQQAPRLSMGLCVAPLSMSGWAAYIQSASLFKLVECRLGELTDLGAWHITMIYSIQQNVRLVLRGPRLKKEA